MVGFQTNLTFPEQQRVFRMIPGLEQAEFARYGVMHRNTFVDAPKVLDSHLLLANSVQKFGTPVYLAGQVSGTEGYVEAIRSGLHVALSVTAYLRGVAIPSMPTSMVFGALLHYATNPETVDYQPSHVNFGMIEPLDTPVRNKKERYAAYAARGNSALEHYCNKLSLLGLL